LAHWWRSVLPPTPLLSRCDSIPIDWSRRDPSGQTNENSVIVFPGSVMFRSPLIGSRARPLPPPLMSRVRLLTPLCAPSRQNAWTPLHVAAYNNQLECVRALLEAGADKDAKGYVRPTTLQPLPSPTQPLPPT
jgi:hypothetical protein